MPTQLSSRNKTSRKPFLRNSTAMLLYLTSGTAAAFSTKGGVAFAGQALRSSPHSLLSRSPPSRRFFAAHQHKRTPTLTVSTTPQATETDAYDVINRNWGLDKYNPSGFENQIYEWWEKTGCFEPDAKQKRQEAENPYVLPMPPPNVTGRLHMGHAIFVALQDVLARFHRMRGRPVLWLPGMFQ